MIVLDDHLLGNVTCSVCATFSSSNSGKSLLVTVWGDENHSWSLRDEFSSQRN